MRALITSAVLCFIASFALPAAAQQPGSLSTSPLAVQSSPVSPEDGASALPSDRLEFEWGLEIATGQTDLVDFTAYAMDWSSLRLADGRILSFAYQYGAGSGPRAIRHGRLGEGVPSSAPPVDEARVFLAPRTWPQIEGYSFLDGFRVASSGALRFVGLWKSETSPERLLVAFDDPASPSTDYVILGRTEMAADVVSGSKPLHGGATRISVATRPGPDGTFRIMTYRWKPGA